MPSLRISRLWTHKMGELESNTSEIPAWAAVSSLYLNLSHLIGKNLMGMSRSKVSELIQEVIDFDRPVIY